MFRKGLSDFKKLLYNKNMLLAFLLILVLGFTFGYYSTDIINRKNQIQIHTDKQDDKKDASIIEEANDIPVNVESGDIRVGSNTKMIFKIKYLKSKDENKEILMPGSELIGLNKKKFKDHYDDWDITSFNQDEIILQKDIDSYSPKNYKVGVAEKDGEVCIAVYYYNKEGEEWVNFISDTPISILNQKERDRFIKGMIFDDIEDVYRMLENYDS